jgi:hypothetical protein
LPAHLGPASCETWLVSSLLLHYLRATPTVAGSCCKPARMVGFNLTNPDQGSRGGGSVND